MNYHKIAIIQFPGSNCEVESIRAIAEAGMEPVEFLWNENKRKLENFDGYFIVGGFSYEDRSRAGVIAAMDPIMRQIRVESEKGKPVLGVCNGAQILVETGLVPGLKNYALGMALSSNRRTQKNNVIGTGFYNNWVYMKIGADPAASAFTQALAPGEILRIPVAHGEGRFVMSLELLEELKRKQSTTFQYCDENGVVRSDFPVNPNGSVFNLAAVSNRRGNILAMMPHPERTPNGAPIFESMKRYITERLCSRFTNYELRFKPKKYNLQTYVTDDNSSELITQLIITDNEAVTVQSTLRELGIDVDIEKFTHWEIEAKKQENKKTRKQIIETGELHNSNKETIIKEIDNLPITVYLLVRDKEDVFGQAKKNALERNFGIDDLKSIKKGKIWKISAENGNIKSLVDKILRTSILFNQFSQECFVYTNHKSKIINHKSITMKYPGQISEQIDNCLTKTNLGVGKKYQGKVRDTYELDDKLILITTDRQSAFDRVLANIPFKGQVLNQTSAWWFEKTSHIIDNHVLSVPDPNVTVAKKCKIFPIEFVVRGYITGTTSTSAWTNYEKGVRNFCGNVLPEGMRKNQKFDSPIITPTTKDEHDRSITPQEIISTGLMTKEEWDYASMKALELFRFGRIMAREHGLILVDTKYEFGKDEQGKIILCDEIHTPDSSRYWIASSYEERFAQGNEPENIDKEFLRLWFKDNCDPYNDAVLPDAPSELVTELSNRYIKLFEMITGREFEFPQNQDGIMGRIQKNLNRFVGTAGFMNQPNTITLPTPETMASKNILCVLILGSTTDEGHAKKITDELDKFGINWAQHVASAHKQAKEALQILDKYQNEKIIYITIAGRSNALSGFVAGNSDKTTIACPPFKDKVDMMVNLNSTIQMPSNVPVITILEPGNVALAIKRIIDL